ncbi:Ionotropic receptor 146, partial [Gryllus bimaculatus]
MAWRATVLVVAITAASATAAPAPAPSPSDLAADAALIGDLARHFQIDAVCLVREEPLNASRHVHLATLQKELSKRSVRNHVASMENFYKKRMKLKHYLFRTLYVITLPDKTGQHFLVEERLPTTNAARVAFAVASLAAIAVSAAYTSALYSNLAVQRERLLFTDIEGMRLTGFRMFFFSDSDTRIMWEHSNAPIRGQFGYSFQYSKGQKDFDEQVCKRDNRGLLELEDNVAMKLRMSSNCHLYRIDGFNMPTPVVMGFSPWFPYVPLFNKRIREMTRVGVVRRLRERPPPVVRLRPEQGDSVALATVLPVLCVLALGALLAAAALAAEVVLR